MAHHAPGPSLKDVAELLGGAWAFGLVIRRAWRAFVKRHVDAEIAKREELRKATIREELDNLAALHEWTTTHDVKDSAAFSRVDERMDRAEQEREQLRTGLQRNTDRMEEMGTQLSRLNGILEGMERRR